MPAKRFFEVGREMENNRIASQKNNGKLGGKIELVEVPAQNKETRWTENRENVEYLPEIRIHMAGKMETIGLPTKE